MFKAKKQLLATLLATTILMIPTFSFASDTVSTQDLSSIDLLASKDSVVLTVNVGSNPGEIGYALSEGGGEGPEAFTVDQVTNTIYISDNVNKRVNVYKDGVFSYEFDVKYSSYIRSIVATTDNIYLMDYDKGIVYTTTLQGELLKNTPLPTGVDSYLMQKLYKDGNGKVWLYYDNTSLLISDTDNSVAARVAGFAEADALSLKVSNSNNRASIVGGNYDISISSSELLNVQVLNTDKSKNLYVDIFEQVDSPKVLGEYTVKKYSGNNLVSVAPISLENYYFSPNNVLELTTDGDLYQINCFKDSIQIVKKGFVSSKNFKSNIDQIKQQALSYVESDVSTMAVKANAPNSRATAQSNANAMSALTWTYKSTNKVNPDSATVSTPDYLVGVTTPSSQTGIPYAWGGNDGLTTRSSSAWTNFTDAMSKNIFAGNVNTTALDRWSSGTAGLDCSGFVGGAAGYTSKLGTWSLADANYTTAIAASSIQIYDIYVAAGDHVLYYTGDNGTSINTREATKTGDDKAKAYSRTKSFLTSEGYVLRRFNGW